jgi:signal transduction histidine kinase
MPRSSPSIVGRLTASFAVGVCASAAILCWFGYHAILEWRRSSVLLAERRSSEAAELLVEALTRDMRGAQQFVLTSPLLRDDRIMARPFQVSSLVASAFAHYPYPESFFLWNGAADRTDAMFFNRADRRPLWSDPSAEANRFPVVIDRSAEIARALLDRVEKDASRGLPWSAFEVELRGVPYQVVASLDYGDPFRRRLSHVTGFTVNLPWVEKKYFSDLTTQVWEIGGASGNGLRLSVTNQQGSVVAGSPIPDRSALTSRREFPMVFFDPDLMFRPAQDMPLNLWAVEVTAVDDASLLQAIRGSNRTLVIGAAATMVLAVGLLLTVRAIRASASLSEMRSDFVSTVTHELKTPIATIRAAAETLSKGRLTGTRFQDYGRLVNLEAKRLGRLVENLLAYSRITDVADVYVFEPLEVAVLFNDIQQEFEAQLDEGGFDLQINIQPGLPPLQGDRLALRLLFDNLIDNSLKYSGTEKTVRLNAAAGHRSVVVNVSDSGIGIPADEIDLVTRKFVRGRNSPIGGSGLGLAIACRIAADHGGSLGIQSVAGQGTTVTVTLPAV